MNTPPRDIGQITNELKNALEREATSIIDIGTLLIEAQDQLPHGKWLEWLEANFGKSIRTARNYMNAARFASKWATVAHLKLKPTALYYLGNNMENIPLDELEVIFKAAGTTWLDDDDVVGIINAFHAARDADDTPPREVGERGPEEAARSEADDIIDGPPPGVPPAPEPVPKDVVLPPFDAALATLAGLQTKSVKRFFGTVHAPDQIMAVAEFLKEVAKANAS